jgi:hypothetical protein
MKLLRARVTNFKSIEDSGWVDIDQVTCLVGKNESGKTAWLHALRKLNPVPGDDPNFDYELEYPRKGLQKYKKVHEDDPATVVEAVFEISDAEAAAIESEFGTGAVKGREITVSKSYENRMVFGTGSVIDEQAIVRHVVGAASLPVETATELAALPRIYNLRARLAQLGAEPPQAAELLAVTEAWRDHSAPKAIIDTVLSPGMPEFFYFDDYSVMRGRIAIAALKQRRDANNLDEADRTFLALLDLVGEPLEEFETLGNQERLIASLEASSNTISDELFAFWSQNKNLKIEFKLLGPDPEAADPVFRESNNLMVRIYNNRHRVSVIFDERSRGFVWFFSFLVYFSQLEEGERNLVLLLDEPALSLHATAQGDFLDFIDQRLATKHQVIYSTHSPFMVDPTKFDRVRTVEDTDEHGTRVTRDVLTTSRDTVFPLQAALGYDLAQTLFIGADNLLVEGPADYLYLRVFSQHLGQLGRTCLDERWVIVPVGGLEKVPTFIALLHNQLNIAVMVDGSGSGLQRIDNMVERGLLEARQLLPLTDITGTKSADIEDLFAVPAYIKLLKDSGTASVAASKLPDGDRIVKRVETVLDHKYDHHRPARYLLEHPERLAELDENTLNRFEQLIREINNRLVQVANT